MKPTIKKILTVSGAIMMLFQIMLAPISAAPAILYGKQTNRSEDSAQTKMWSLGDLVFEAPQSWQVYIDEEANPHNALFITDDEQTYILLMLAEKEIRYFGNEIDDASLAVYSEQCLESITGSKCKERAKIFTFSNGAKASSMTDAQIDTNTDGTKEIWQYMAISSDIDKHRLGVGVVSFADDFDGDIMSDTIEQLFLSCHVADGTEDASPASVTQEG